MSPLKFVGTNIDGLLGRAEQLKVHDSNLNDLIGQCSFTDALFHILLGEVPTDQQRKLLDIVLVAFHGGFGLLPPTTLVPRLVAGTGVSVPQALAAGYLASGPFHVGAVEQAMKLYQQIETSYLAQQQSEKTDQDLEKFAADFVQKMMDRNETIHGFGHPFFRVDPRPVHIRRLLAEMDFQSPYLPIYDGVTRGANQRKPVQPNVDGITGVVLLSLGMGPEHGTGLFLLARTAAMLAHIIEEQTVMPYQTQKRFMGLNLGPLFSPKLFNIDWVQASKYFNQLRDNRFYRKFLGLAKRSYRAREKEDRDVVSRSKQRPPKSLSEFAKEVQQEVSSDSQRQGALSEPLLAAIYGIMTAADQMGQDETSEKEKLHQALELLQDVTGISQRGPDSFAQLAKEAAEDKEQM